MCCIILFNTFHGAEVICINIFIRNLEGYGINIGICICISNEIRTAVQQAGDIIHAYIYGVIYINLLECLVDFCNCLIQCIAILCEVCNTARNVKPCGLLFLLCLQPSQCFICGSKFFVCRCCDRLICIGECLFYFLLISSQQIVEVYGYTSSSSLLCDFNLQLLNGACSISLCIRISCNLVAFAVYKSSTLYPNGVCSTSCLIGCGIFNAITINSSSKSALLFEHAEINVINDGSCTLLGQFLLDGINDVALHIAGCIDLSGHNCNAIFNLYAWIANDALLYFFYISSVFIREISRINDICNIQFKTLTFRNNQCTFYELCPTGLQLLWFNVQYLFHTDGGCVCSVCHYCEALCQSERNSCCNCNDFIEYLLHCTFPSLHSIFL